MQVSLLEGRHAAALEAAQARFRSEVEGVAAQLRLLRLRQSRVMAYVDDCLAEEEQGEGEEG